MQILRQNLKRFTCFCRERCMLVIPAAAGALAVTLVLAILTLNQAPLSSSPFDYPPDDTSNAYRLRTRQDPARIEDTLARFLYDWPDSESRDRAAMARFFGFFRYDPAVEALRREASRLHGESAVASLQALAAMGDVASLPLFREVIRKSKDCKAVALAAEVLGAWRDHGSYSTLLYYLLEPRCEGPALLEVARAVGAIRHPFAEELLFFVHQETASPESKLVTAALLAPRVSGKARRSAVEATLRAGMLQAAADLSVDVRGEEQALLVALWGMSRHSTDTCRDAREFALDLFQRSVGQGRRAVARDVLLAGMPCFHTNWKKHRVVLNELMAAADSLDLSLAEFDDMGRSLELPLNQEPGFDPLEPAWVDWLVQLASRFTLWDETRSVAQFAQSIEQLERVQESVRRSPSELVTIDRSVRAPRHRFSTLEKLAGDWHQGADFKQYDYTPGQPEWWPEWIDITIDDGPRPTRLRRYLDTFDQYGVKATFFFIGTNIARYWGTHPDRARKLLQRMVDSGHRIGYHSMVHDTHWKRHLQNWTPEQIQDDIVFFRATLERVLGRPWDGLLGRLPGGMGRRYRHVQKGFALAGLRAHVHWNVQDPTWGPSTHLGDVRALARRLVRDRESAVILLHEYEGLNRQLDVFMKEVHKEVSLQRQSASL